MTSGPAQAGGTPLADPPGQSESPHPAVPQDTEPWHRVHFISPLVRGWIALVAILYFVGRDWFEGLFDAGTRGRSPLPEGVGPLVAGGVLLGVVVLIALVFLVSWYFTRYQVTADHVRVHSGVVFRQQRQARLDRVQAIDIVQPLLARIFGLAELKFEVADAGKSAVRLAFLKIDDAKRLRATILARAAGVQADPEHPEEVIEAPEREVVAIPPRRVIGAALLSGTTVALVIVGAVVVVLGIVLETAVVGASFIPILIGVAGAYWSVLSTGYNFRAATSPDGIRMRYGLLDTRAQTVPPGRVQALSITQSPLWRIKGWYRVKVNVAGYGLAASNEGQARATLLPVGTRDEVLQIVALVLPDPGTVRPVEIFSAGMTGRDGAEGFVTTPRRARWLAPLAWRRNGYAVTDTALLVRSGVLWRQLVVVPHERTQSISLHQGPIGRRVRVADLQFQTTPGPVTPRVIQTDADAAWELFHGQSARAAAARSRSGPEQWMKPVPARDVSEPAAPVSGPQGIDVEYLRAEGYGADAAPSEPFVPGDGPSASPAAGVPVSSPVSDAAADPVPGTVPANAPPSGAAADPAPGTVPTDAPPSGAAAGPAPGAPSDVAPVRQVMPEVPTYLPASGEDTTDDEETDHGRR